jgi:hypothetical protein
MNYLLLALAVQDFECSITLVDLDSGHYFANAVSDPATLDLWIRNAAN